MNTSSKIRRCQRIITTNIKYPQRMSNFFGITYTKIRKPVYHRFLPSYIDIEPTIRCNLKCPSCHSPLLKRNQKDLTFSLFKNILDQFKTLLEVKISGMGEPLLNKDFFKMVRYARSKNISAYSFSNAKIIDHSIAKEIIQCGLKEMIISVDGATPQTHNSIRTGSDLNQVLSAIDILISTRGKLKYPKISVWFVGRKSNIHELSDLLDTCQKLNIDCFGFQHDLTYWGKEYWRKKMRDNALDSNFDFTEEVIKDAQQKASRLGIEFINFTKNKFYKKRGKECFWPWQSCFIATDGRVVPCCIIADPEIISLGDLCRETFRDIWNGSNYQSFRKKIKEHNIPAPCRDCYENA